MKLVKHIVLIPFIWLPLLPLILLHLCIFIYQAVGFRLCGIERVKLRQYLCFDREKLNYLSVVDKINCLYCSYSNGLFSYMQEIGRRTEYYWCGVKHKTYPGNPAFAYQSKFASYGNKKEYNEVLIKSGRKTK